MDKKGKPILIQDLLKAKKKRQFIVFFGVKNRI